MPVYCFVCPKCGAKKEVLRPMSQSGDSLFCKDCEGPSGQCFPMHRDLQTEQLGSSGMDYDTPVYSDAMGINPDQIPAFKKAHPNVEVARDGRIVLRSHYERKRVMKELGYMDRNGF